MWKEISDLFVESDTPVSEVLDVIDRGGVSLALVTADHGRLLGTITDGDVRRALLRATPLSTPARFVMNPHPVTADENTGRETLIALMLNRRKKQIPLLRDGQVVDVAILDRLLEPRSGPARSSAPVVIMCGGLGTRLRPLTDTVPKPLLPVRGRPLIEHTLERLAAEGFDSVYLSVHYRPEAFERIDGSRFDLHIETVHEERRLGTAGALGRLRDRLSEPFLVVNGDVLTEMRFRALLDFHLKRDFLVTVSVKPYELRVPYGVVEVRGDDVVSIAEKPLHQYLTNAGVYALNPEVVSRIVPGEFVDMDELIVRVLEGHGRVGAFPVHERWIDIGRPQSYSDAQGVLDRVLREDPS